MTNDYESTPEEIVEFYNKRGAKERIFDDLNNSFGWNRLPKSFMNENTVFLLIKALIRNFYQFLVQAKELKSSDRHQDGVWQRPHKSSCHL